MSVNIDTAPILAVKADTSSFSFREVIGMVEIILPFSSVCFIAGDHVLISKMAGTALLSVVKEDIAALPSE